MPVIYRLNRYFYLSVALCLVGELFASPCISATEKLAATEHRLLILGDSLTEGYGVGPDDAFPVVLEQLLHAKGYNQIKIQAAGAGMTPQFTPLR